MLRLPRRIATVIAVVAVVWLLFYTLEPRRTAFSCKTFGLCIGIRTRHSYRHPLPNLEAQHETESQLRDGTLRFTRASDATEPEILFLVLNKDATSWSRDFRSTQRTIYDFLDVLVSTQIDFRAVSLAILTDSPEEFAKIKTATSTLPFARSTILLRQNVEDGTNYEDRHRPAVQLARRSNLATLRNYLMLSALRDEAHLIWIDGDVVELSPEIVPTMIQHSQNNEDAGLLTALCHQNQMDNYDKNAWKVDTDGSHLLGPIADDSRETATRQLVDTRFMIPDLIKDSDDRTLISLDSVGGTILYLRSSLVRQGLTFPHFNIVGTTWSKAGWIGVETEGICYAARGLKGGGCYALGGRHHVRHTDWG